MIVTLLFYIFAAAILFSGLMVVLSRNPVHSVLFLIFAFFNSAGLFLLLGAEFIAMLTVIVYVGAVAVLFLFIVMMLNVDFCKFREGFSKYLPIGAGMAVILLVEIILVLQSNIGEVGKKAAAAKPVPDSLTNTESIGNLLYTDFVFPFQICGIILLVAMIGAIVLSHRVREGVKKQNISKQLARKREDSIEVLKIQPGKGV